MSAAKQAPVVMDDDRIRCPVHGIPDCSPLLNGCSIPNQLIAWRERAVVALESECAALAAALGRWTHDFAPDETLPGRCAVNHGLCGRVEVSWVHRTPARVRAELEGQA
jgi:hypothetical protein